MPQERSKESILVEDDPDCPLTRSWASRGEDLDDRVRTSYTDSAAMVYSNRTEVP